MMKIPKRIIAIGVSALLLGVLIASVDRSALRAALEHASPAWLAAAMLLFVPQIGAVAWRWRMIARPVARLSFRESGRQVVASNCLNLVLPSKLGDLAKGVFLHRQGRCGLNSGMHVVLFEKFMDLAALAAWMVIGWLLVPRMEPWVLVLVAGGCALVGGVWLLYFTNGGPALIMSLAPKAITKQGKGKLGQIIAKAPEAVALVRARGDRQWRIVGWSLAIWFLHLLQIWCFFRAVGIDASLFAVLASMPIAIFAGLLPLTMAGVGTRDWAIVAVFAGAASPATLVAAGLLVSLRYVVPALVGLPFIPRYFAASKRARRALSEGGAPDAAQSSKQRKARR